MLRFWQLQYAVKFGDGIENIWDISYLFHIEKLNRKN